MNVCLGAALQVPAISLSLMPNHPPGMLTHLLGLVAMFLGLVLVYCSRDLPHRATLVIWEGILRCGGFAVMSGYGYFGGEGMQATVSGFADLAIGAVYLVALPRFVGMPLVDLLLDRRS